VVVVSGETVSDVVVVAPMPLSMLVVLAFATLHESTEFCPAVIVDGVAINEVTVGAGIATVAEQVDVAIVDDASVA
jgi:hypothetical protein